MLLALALAALGLVLSEAPARAATIPVNTIADENGTNLAACSLREAITSANTDTAFGGCTTGSGDDTITVPAGTYVLTIVGVEDANAAGDLNILTNVTIALGPGGRERLTIQVPCSGGACPDIRVGDEIEADGYQNGVGDGNSYFVAADGITVTRDGHRVH